MALHSFPLLRKPGAKALDNPWLSAATPSGPPWLCTKRHPASRGKN